MKHFSKTTFLSKEEYREGTLEAKSVCMIVLNPNGDGSILAITKQKEFGNIGFPGGRIDLQIEETAEDAAVRECFEETGILVDKSTIVPVYWGLGRTMISFAFLAQDVIGGKLHCMTREGMPMWVNIQSLLRDECAYKYYNVEVIKKLLSANVPIGT